MYKIELRRKAQRSLDKLPKDDFAAVLDAVKGLANTPRPKGMEKIKSAGLWRIRQWDYRIVYSIDDSPKTVTILRIGHRREIYRSLWFTLFFVSSFCLRDSFTCPSEYFSRTMIIKPNQLIHSWLGIISNRPLFLYELKSISSNLTTSSGRAKK